MLVDGPRIAVIERRLEGACWYVLPGGGVDAGETPQQAARREAQEELGLEVRVGALVATIKFHRADGGVSTQLYFSTEAVGGGWGRGSGAELGFSSDSPRGTYAPFWLDLACSSEVDVRPRALVEAVQHRGMKSLALMPLNLQEHA